MTEANAGSLLVFDESKLRLKEDSGCILSADKEAVVGIFTERGTALRLGRELGTFKGRACWQWDSRCLCVMELMTSFCCV